MDGDQSVRVSCPRCGGFLFEGFFRSIRVPHCGGDVFAAAPADFAVSVRWSPRVRGRARMASAPTTATPAPTGQFPSRGAP